MNEWMNEWIIDCYDFQSFIHKLCSGTKHLLKKFSLYRSSFSNFYTCYRLTCVFWDTLKWGQGGNSMKQWRLVYQQELKPIFTPGQRASSVSAYDIFQFPCAISDWLGNPLRRKKSECSCGPHVLRCGIRHTYRTGTGLVCIEEMDEVIAHRSFSFLFPFCVIALVSCHHKMLPAEMSVNFYFLPDLSSYWLWVQRQIMLGKVFILFFPHCTHTPQLAHKHADKHAEIFTLCSLPPSSLKMKYIELVVQTVPLDKRPSHAEKHLPHSHNVDKMPFTWSIASR